MDDESQIRELQQLWFRASETGDLPTVLDLMTDDVVFLTAGREPFGKAEFEQSLRASREQVNVRVSGSYDEIVVVGDVAYTRAQLSVVVTPRNGAAPKSLKGYALTVLRRCSDGSWRVCRDANLLSPA